MTTLVLILDLLKLLIFQPEIGLIQEPKQVKFDQPRPFNFPWYSEYLYKIVTISYQPIAYNDGREKVLKYTKKKEKKIRENNW